MQLTRREMILSSVTAALSACAKPAPPKVGEGRIGVLGGNVVWRRSGTVPRLPLILIHGGPGFPSDYLEPLGALGDERPVYVWDQLGCGRSDRPSSAALWTVERFVQEFDAVRAALAPGPSPCARPFLGLDAGDGMAGDEATGNSVVSVTFAGECLSVPRYIGRCQCAHQNPDARVSGSDRRGRANRKLRHAGTIEAAFKSDWVPRYLTRNGQRLRPMIS